MNRVAQIALQWMGFLLLWLLFAFQISVGELAGGGCRFHAGGACASKGPPGDAFLFPSQTALACAKLASSRHDCPGHREVDEGCCQAFGGPGFTVVP